MSTFTISNDDLHHEQQSTSTDSPTEATLLLIMKMTVMIPPVMRANISTRHEHDSNKRSHFVYDSCLHLTGAEICRIADCVVEQQPDFYVYLSLLCIYAADGTNYIACHILSFFKAHMKC